MSSRCVLVALALLARAAGAAAQSTTQVAATSTFAPGGEELFALDFARATIGSFPGTIRRLSGTLEVVTKDGTPMLRASEQSEFLISLSRPLPQSFTIEVDIVPKDCCPPPDLTLEGTATINQGTSSAHLLWTADASFGWVGVVGGATDNHEFQMPDEVRVALPGSLAKVGVSVDGGTIKFYTNGRQLYSVQAQFARGSVLRVTLGGQKDEEGSKPVYLARVRVATGAPAMVTAINATTTGTITPIATSSASAVLPPRTITLSGFSAVGDFSSLTARTVTLVGFTAVGEFGRLARALTLPGFTAAGLFAGLAPRTVTLSGFAAAGLFGSLAPRTITIPGFTATGFGSLSPRSITITGFTAAGLFASLTPRAISLPGFTAVGYGSLAPRTVTLTGFTAAGAFTTLPPRTITLPGFTAVRIP